MDGKRTLAEAILDATKSGLEVRLSHWNGSTTIDLRTTYIDRPNMEIGRCCPVLGIASFADELLAATLDEAAEKLQRGVMRVTNDQQP